MNSSLKQHIKYWVTATRLTAVEVDCAIAVMLKIIDGKCKMAAEEKTVMSALYEEVRGMEHSLLQPDVHELISRSRGTLDEDLKLEVYEKRVLAETVISRPVMKAFKARIRKAGLFDY